MAGILIDVLSVYNILLETFKGPIMNLGHYGPLKCSSKMLFTSDFPQELDKYTGHEDILYGSGFGLLCSKEEI